MRHDFQCKVCSHIQEELLSFSQYDQWQAGAIVFVCKECGGTTEKLVAVPQGSVRLADCEITKLGHLADRNSSRLSDDHKAALEAKHTSYRTNKDYSKELPKGMKWEKRPEHGVEFK